MLDVLTFFRKKLLRNETNCGKKCKKDFRFIYLVSCDLSHRAGPAVPCLYKHQGVRPQFVQRSIRRHVAEKRSVREQTRIYIV